MKVIQKTVFVLHKLRSAGFSEVRRRAFQKMGSIFSRQTAEPAPPSEFDSAHGVNTDGSISLTAVQVESPNCIYGTKYIPANPELLRSVLRELDLEPWKYIFVDLGSGKGRQLLVASEFPFKRVVGAEFAVELHEAAVENVRNYQNAGQQCKEIVPLLMDVVEFSCPAEPLVLFSYNSFEPPVFEKVLAKIEHSWRANPRDIVFIYANPVHDALFSRFSFFRKLQWNGFEGELQHHRAALYRTVQPQSHVESAGT